MHTKQLDIFEFSLKNQNHQDKSQLYIDGASRSNPGPAGAGIYLKSGSKVVMHQGFFLGNKTNNQAEYAAFLIGIYYIYQCNMQNTHITIYSDSLLLVQQIMRKYKVKNEVLKHLFSLADRYFNQLPHVSIQHIRREYNTEADAAANKGIDMKQPVPKDFFIFFNIDIL